MANKNWKKTTAALGLSLSLCLALPGCAVEDNPGGKFCQIEFLSADTQEVLATLDQQSQQQALSVLQIDDWEMTPKPEEELIPEYIIAVNQERTPTLLSMIPFIRAEEEARGEGYIQILEFTTYKDSNYILQNIETEDFAEQSMVPNFSIPIYYKVTDEIIGDIREAAMENAEA